jgi:hypothetical protein
MALTIHGRLGRTQAVRGGEILRKFVNILVFLMPGQDLKSWVPQGACGFETRPRHNFY